MNFKQKFVTTTAMALSLISAYGRRSYAACVTSAYQTYLCSGTNTSSQNFSLFNDATVSTAPGFSVNTNSGPAIQFSGDGNFSFTDLYHSYIASSGASSAGLSLINYSIGSITINVNSHIVSTSSNGIFAENAGSGPLTIITDEDSVITGGGIYSGISAINNGTSASALTINGSVTGPRYGVGIVNGSNTTDLTITTGANSHVSSTDNLALYAINNGSGDLSISHNGEIYSRYTGIRATNAGSSMTITTSADSIINAKYGTGILATNTHGTSTVNVDGTVNAGVFGLNITNNGGTDTIITTGDDSFVSGKYVYGISTRHSGTGILSITSNGDVYGGNTGIFARSYSGSAGLSINTGTASSITGNNRYGIDARNSGSNTGGLSITANGNVSSNSTGIFVRNYSMDTSIHIGANSIITGTNQNGISVRHNGSGGLSIENHGTITGDTGILIRNEGGTSNGLFTDGIIEGTGGLAIYFTPDYNGYIYQSTATPIEIAGGRIIGDVIDTNTQRGFSPVTVSGDFISEGNFQVSDFNVSSTGNFTLSAGNDLYSYNTIDVDGVFNADGGSVSANLSVNNGGTLNVNEDLNLDFGDFTNNGVTSIATGKTLIVDTMMAGTGELRFGFNDVNDHALLTVANGAADLTGQHIVVDVTGVTGLATGEQALIVTGQAPIIGGPGGTAIDVDDTSFLWNFQMVDGTGVGAPTSANDLFLIAGQSAPLNTLTTTTNNLHAANVLMTLQSTTNPELAQIVGNMNGASTQAEFNEVLEAVQPTNDMGESRIAADNTRRLMDIAMTRLDDLRDLFGRERKADTASLSQTGTLPEQKTGMQAWAMGFGDNPDDGSLDDNHGLDALNNREWQSASGQYSRQDARGGIDGYKAISGGAAVGIDTGNTLKDTVFGLALSYAHSKIDSDNANRSELSIDGYQAMFYASKNLRDNAYFDFMASYAQNNNDTTRHDVGGVPGLTAKGDFTSREIGLKGKLGQRIAYGDYTLAPAFSLNWLHYMADDYTETGAGGANLSVKSNSLDSLEVGYDLKVSREMKRDDGAILIPQVHAGYYYDVIGDSLQKTSAFAGGGASFTTESPDPARHRINMGAGVTWRGTGKWDYSLTYDLDARQDFVGHTAMAKAAFRF